MPRFIFLTFIILSLQCGCTSAQISPEPIAPPQQDEKAAFRDRAKHPDGFNISDVKALFIASSAPTLESLKNCDFDYYAETTLARNREELFMALPEHIKTDPEKYHWCFYAKILLLEDELSNEKLYVDERNKLLIQRYPFLVHIARIFLADFDDPRYLEFANHNYKRLKNR